MPRGIACVVPLAACAAAGSVMGQPVEGEDPPPPGAERLVENLPSIIPARIGAIWENDSYYHTWFDEEDANYTEGLRLDLSWQPAWALDAAMRLPLSEQFQRPRAAVGVAIGQNLYTPDNLKARHPLPDEHPYGAFLYAGFYLQRTDQRRFDHLELDIGSMGDWAGGEGTQKFIHRIIESPNPEGWQNQTGNEIGANLTLTRTWRFGAGLREQVRTEVLPYLGGTAGTVFTNARAGATFRVGWNMPDDYGLTRIGQVADQTSPPVTKGLLGGYVFARLGGRLVAHDTFLDGSLFRDDGVRVGHEPLVGEAQVGIAVTIGRYLDLHYSQTWWTEEFASQGHGQHFGAYGLSVHFDF